MLPGSGISQSPATNRPAALDFGRSVCYTRGACAWEGRLPWLRRGGSPAFVAYRPPCVAGDGNQITLSVTGAAVPALAGSVPGVMRRGGTQPERRPGLGRG